MLPTAIEHRFFVEEFEFPMTETKLCASLCSMVLQFYELAIHALLFEYSSDGSWLLHRESIFGSTSLT
jgi:hypothetical protein